MKVLVLMAVYNGEKFIEEQIKSILEQEGVEVFLLISDDNSTDKSVDIINKFIEIGAPIKLIRRSKGSGSAARNFLSLINSADFYQKFDAVAFSDQDDIWLPKKLFCTAKYMLNDKETLYMSNLIMWDENSDRRTLIRKSHKQKKYDFLFEGGSAGCTYVMNRFFFEKLRSMVRCLSYVDWPGFSHDWLVYFFARIINGHVVIDSTSQILYRIHRNNVHGHLNVSSIASFLTKLRMVRDGWYLHHMDGFAQLLDKNSLEHNIIQLYSRGVFFRIFVLMKYNFSLIRSPLKFLQFALLSFLPQIRQHV